MIQLKPCILCNSMKHKSQTQVEAYNKFIMELWSYACVFCFSAYLGYVTQEIVYFYYVNMLFFGSMYNCVMQALVDSTFHMCFGHSYACIPVSKASKVNKIFLQYFHPENMFLYSSK